MKIAQIAPLYEAVPPKLYGGTERVVANLCDALSDAGHDVSLFASGDSHTRARLVPARAKSLRLDPNPLKSDCAAHLNMLYEVRERADDFDVLHFHTEAQHFPLFEDLAARTVTTLHNRLDIEDLQGTLQRWPSFGLVSISDAQRQPVPSANWLSTVQHGLPRDLFHPRRRASGSYLAFLGRIAPEKGPDIAIRLARRSGIPLKIAAKVDSVDAQYFSTVVQPLLNDPLIEFVGEISDADKSEFLGNAHALLFPVQWPEPFGLVMIESMACGTPVIAWKRGSVAEIVDGGVTGFVVSSEEEALGAIQRVSALDRARIRGVFERRFSAQTMAQAYLRIYERLLQPVVSKNAQVRLVS